MLEGNAPNRYAAVFIYNIMYARINGMENNLKCDAFAVNPYDIVQKILKLQRTVNMQFSRSAQQSHRTDKTGQTKNMISVIVR